MDLVYPNGFKVPAKKMDLLNEIPSDPGNDRLFINTAFFIFFSEKRLRKQVKNGLNRLDVLKKFRDSSKYELMRAIYNYRVLSNGCADANGRIRLFGSIFRIKLNNWWRHMSKTNS